MNPSAPYWNGGIARVPGMTGAVHVMDGSDLVELSTALNFDLPLGSVLDVGCGTGRIAPYCRTYLGADISVDAIAYCTSLGREAVLIDGPEDLPDEAFDWVTCLSVFTHIDRDERLAYLDAFASRASRLLVDIIAGDGSGDVAMWTADPYQFGEDLRLAGWMITATTERTSPQGRLHLYFRAVA